MPGSVLSQSVELVQGFLSGRKTCTDLLFTRYKTECEQLAAARLSSTMRRRIDPEDIYQSVSLTLMQGLREGRFRITRTGDLWKLLRQAVSLRIMKRVEYHCAAQRDVRCEFQSFETSDAAVELREMLEIEELEEIEHFLRRAPSAKARLVYEAILSGRSTAEAAELAECSRAWVGQLLRDALRELTTRPPLAGDPK